MRNFKTFFDYWSTIKVRQSRNDFFQANVSSKKQTNEFYFTTMKPQVDLFWFVFLEKIEDTKKTFRNYLTFTVAVGNSMTDIKLVPPPHSIQQGVLYRWVNIDMRVLDEYVVSTEIKTPDLMEHYTTNLWWSFPSLMSVNYVECYVNY